MTDDPEQIPDGPSQEELRDTAAVREAHYWKGKAIETFSLGRQLLAQRALSDGSSALERAIVVVYSCTRPEEECDKARGHEEEAAFRLKAHQWAESEGVSIVEPSDIMALFNEIWRELEASRFKVAAAKRDGPKDPPPPNG